MTTNITRNLGSVLCGTFSKESAKIWQELDLECVDDA